MARTTTEVGMTMGGSFDVYEADTSLKAHHILFRRKQPWEPLKPLHRLHAAAKHLLKQKKEK